MIDALYRYVAYLSSAAVVAMMAVGAADVVGTLAGRPLPGAFELTESLMVACVFFALAHTERSGQHIRVEILPKALPAPVARALDAIAGVLSALFAAAIAYYGWRAFGRSVAQGEFASGIVQFALWPARLALALGASLMVVASLGRVADALRGRAGPVHSGGAGH